MDREWEIQEFDCKKQTHGSVILKNKLFLIMKKANHSFKISNPVFFERVWMANWKKKNHIFYMCTNASERALLNILNAFLKSVTVWDHNTVYQYF